MSTNKEIYDQFYNSDAEFKNTFSDLKSFDEYVGGNQDVIENLKQIYSFEPTSSFEMLTKNIEYHELKNIKFFNLAETLIYIS